MYLASAVNSSKEVTPLKASLPIDSTPIKVNSSANLSQPLNALAPITFKEAGKVTFLKIVQPSNACSPISSNPSANTRSFNLVCSLANLAGIDFNFVLLITNFVILADPI